MAYYFPEGTKLFYSVTFAAAKTVSALSNANPASATSAAHGYIDNDEVLFLSGWEEANESVFRVDQIDAATHTFLGLDATNTQLFPPGGGVGTTQKISTWVEVPQVLTITGSGGDAKYGTIAPLAKRQEIQRAIGFNASATNFTMGWDPANATYQAMLALARTQQAVALKILVAGIAPIYGYGNISVSQTPNMARGQVIDVPGSVTMNGRPIAYAS